MVKPKNGNESLLEMERFELKINVVQSIKGRRK